MDAPGLLNGAAMASAFHEEEPLLAGGPYCTCPSAPSLARPLPFSPVLRGSSVGRGMSRTVQFVNTFAAEREVRR
jgi:hypothetical protein